MAKKAILDLLVFCRVFGYVCFGNSMLRALHIEKTKQRSEKQSSVLSIDQIQWYTVCNDVHTDF